MCRHAPLLFESGRGLCVRGLDGEMFDLSQARHIICEGSSRRQPWTSWIHPGSPSSGRQVAGDGPGTLGLGPGAPEPSPEVTGSTLPDTDPAIWREHEEIVLGGGVPRMIWTFWRWLAPA